MRAYDAQDLSVPMRRKMGIEMSTSNHMVWVAEARTIEANLTRSMTRMTITILTSRAQSCAAVCRKG